MKNESAHATNVTSLDRRRPGAAFSRTAEEVGRGAVSGRRFGGPPAAASEGRERISLEPELVLLPDMSHTNGRGVVELIAKALSAEIR